MKLTADIILRRVRPMGGAVTDIAIRDGAILAMAPNLIAIGPDLDGAGKAILPGLIDHHIHLLATAAKTDSVDLSGLLQTNAIAERLQRHAACLPAGTWIRAIGFDEGTTALPDRHDLDNWVAQHPLRIQGRTGGLWLMNSAAISMLGSGPFPSGVEIDGRGMPTGRFWRVDGWLREMLPASAPSLAPLSSSLAKMGITGLVDAGAQNGPSEAQILAKARRDGSLRQTLMVMGKDIPPACEYHIGPRKLQFDDHDLPDIADVSSAIRSAHAEHRPVAAHCVTLAELIVFLTALEDAGTRHGLDRIEHGGIIPHDLFAVIKARNLTVVTQPSFIANRGDRYLATVPAEDLPDLYRLRSLIEAGIKVALSSDAPYGSPDPWQAIKAARDRQTQTGALLGESERISAAMALSLYLGDFHDPGGPPRAVATGATANLCLLSTSLDDMLAEPDSQKVRTAIIDGVPTCL